MLQAFFRAAKQALSDDASGETELIQNNLLVDSGIVDLSNGTICRLLQAHEFHPLRTWLLQSKGWLSPTDDARGLTDIALLPQEAAGSVMPHPDFRQLKKMFDVGNTVRSCTRACVGSTACAVCRLLTLWVARCGSVSARTAETEMILLPVQLWRRRYA